MLFLWASVKLHLPCTVKPSDISAFFTRKRKALCVEHVYLSLPVRPRMTLHQRLDLLSDFHEIQYRNSYSSSRWRYSPGWTLFSATIRLQVSRFLALPLHSFIPIFLRSMDTSSSHLILGLPLRLVAYGFPYSIFFFGIAVSCILSICPSHRI